MRKVSQTVVEQKQIMWQNLNPKCQGRQSRGRRMMRILGPSSTSRRNLTHVLTLSQWTAWFTVTSSNVELNDMFAEFRECKWEQEMNA